MDRKLLCRAKLYLSSGFRVRGREIVCPLYHGRTNRLRLRRVPR